MQFSYKIFYFSTSVIILSAVSTPPIKRLYCFIACGLSTLIHFLFLRSYLSTASWGSFPQYGDTIWTTLLSTHLTTVILLDQVATEHDPRLCFWSILASISWLLGPCNLLGRVAPTTKIFLWLRCNRRGIDVNKLSKNNLWFVLTTSRTSFVSEINLIRIGLLNLTEDGAEFYHIILTGSSFVLTTSRNRTRELWNILASLSVLLLNFCLDGDCWDPSHPHFIINSKFSLWTSFNYIGEYLDKRDTLWLSNDWSWTSIDVSVTRIVSLLG